MAHWREMMDNSQYVTAFDLKGKDVTVEIERVVGGEITGQGGKKSKKPLAYFKNGTKPLGLNVTNCKTIARMYGNDTSAWAGKKITLYTAMTEKDGEEIPCVRVRPQVSA